MTYEMNYIKNVLEMLSRNDKLNLLKTSNLNDREIELLTMRFVQGKSLKDCADYFKVEIDTINKAQLKTVKKLYSYLKNS